MITYYSKRDDFCHSESEFESLFIEVNLKHQQNIVCGVIYRYPNANIDKTLCQLYDIVDKISRENKYCVLLRGLQYRFASI